MEFRTRVDIPNSDVMIDHSVEMMLLGSCFSSHIGLKLQQNKFRVDVNPFGILFNPFSIASAILRLLKGKNFTEADLVQYKGVYHSFMHHGEFSSPSMETCLRNISDRFERACATIRETDLFLITFGTAYVYWRKVSGEIAANCHKFPENEFHRARLSVKEIVEEWSELLEVLLTHRPNVKVVFTVSPIRHLRDGARENQVSKSILHLAIDELQDRFKKHVRYFPAYEILLDELRDYRFYSEDMVHPSRVSVDYIWERFSDTFFSPETRSLNKEWEGIRKSLEHRALHPNDDSHRHFLENTWSKLKHFKERYPIISCEEEERELMSRLHL